MEQSDLVHPERNGVLIAFVLLVAFMVRTTSTSGTYQNLFINVLP